LSISVILADDHPVVRQGLRSALTVDPEFSISAETADGLETVRLVERLQPDVLILDLLMPGLNGLDVLPIVRQRAPRTRVVLFTPYAHEDLVLRAMKNGASACVLKSCNLDRIVDAVRSVIAGRRYLSPGVSAPSFDACQERARSAQDPHDRLTPRERQALQLAGEGHSCAAIAARLSISRRTAETHRANALRKLGLKSQADLVRYAIRRGMLPLED
jgi:DNA-binding NarL/FixJ family response regulator